MQNGSKTKKTKNNGRVLAIIPCLNEEATIGSTVLRTKRYVDEVLVIDDGSKDETKQVAEEAGAIVISHKTNKGKAAGIKTGFNYMLENKFDYLVTLDGDGQHNPCEIPALLGALYGGRADISLGVRWGDTTEMPRWRKVGKRVLDIATSTGSGGVVTDSQCGFRAFNYEAVKGIYTRLKGDSFIVESEQLIRANELGLKIVDTRVSCRYDHLDTSTKNPTSHGFSVLRAVIYLVAEKRPLLFIALPGFIVMLVGFFWGIITLQHYNVKGVFLISYAIITAILMIMGTIAMFIGLVLNTLPNIIEKTIQRHEEEFFNR